MKKQKKKCRPCGSTASKSPRLILKSNKHHILYPQNAWTRLGPVGVFLREGFVVRMPYGLHKKLHRKIDKTLGGYVWSDKLPKKSTLQYLERELLRNYSFVQQMHPIDKIEWLMARLSYDDAHSYWLKTMLNRQRDFYLEHEGEV